jgi:hypothetical protein
MPVSHKTAPTNPFVRVFTNSPWAGARQIENYALCLLANTECEAENYAEAMQHIDEALFFSACNGVCFLDAELWRQKSLALSRSCRQDSNAYDHLVRALDIATAQASPALVERVRQDLATWPDQPFRFARGAKPK